MARLNSVCTVLATVLLTAAPALGGERDYVLEWLPPAGSVDGYRVLLGPQVGTYDETADLGYVDQDPDGICRATLILDAAQTYHVAMTAWNAYGESDLSNEIRVAASACDPAVCDDGDPCTADDCSTSGCTHSTIPDGTVCGAAGQLCVAGSCRAVECLQDADCTNADSCDGDEVCVDFFCAAGPRLECPAPTQCRDSGCSAESGCWSVDLPDGTVCDDGSASTFDDRCVAGQCTGVPATAELSVTAVTPEVVAPGRVRLHIGGSGFDAATQVRFAGGAGPTPAVSRVTWIDPGLLEVVAEIRPNGPRRARHWDVIVRDGQGREAVLDGGLIVQP